MLQCVILAGGRGSRIASYTATLPKCLVPIGGKPFIDYQLEWLVAQGVTEVVLALGYKSALVQEHLKNSPPQGLRLQYSDEGEELQGTAGALRTADQANLLKEKFFILYGDSMVDLCLAEVERLFLHSGQLGLMTVFHNRGQLDHSNVMRMPDGGWHYSKNPCDPQFYSYIDYGLLALTKTVIRGRITDRGPSDLAPLFEGLSNEKKLAFYQVNKRFYEIGSYQGLSDFTAKVNRDL